MNLLIIHGTDRKDNKSQIARDFIKAEADKNTSIESRVIDPSQFDTSPAGEWHNDAYESAVKWADAYFIVTPEYNHSIPGTLKNLLDMQYKEYKYKPIAIAGVSAGPWGGVRAIEDLIPTLKAVGMYPIQPDVQFPNIGDFNENKYEEYAEKLKQPFAELIKISKALSDLQNN